MAKRFAAVCLALAIACGSGTPAGVGVDAGAALDGGSPTDGGTAQDGGASIDAGAIDGGATLDGGVAQDAGVGADGGSGFISELVVVTRTGDGTFDGSDGRFQFCASASRCFDLDNPEVNDLQSGQVDHFRLRPSALRRSDIRDAVLRVRPDTAGAGDDGWRPTCLAVIADGDLLYCRNLSGVLLGSDAGDQTSFSEVISGAPGCASCYGGALTHGPLVGHTTANSARIWVRTGSARPVALRYSTSADLSAASETAPVVPAASRDFTAQIELQDLAPSTRYYYEVKQGGAAISASGLSFKTAPAAIAPFKLAFGSCVNHERFPDVGIFEAIVAAAPDVFVFIGDNHYANTADPDRLAFFYRKMREPRFVAQLGARTPTWAVWDDHDFVGNNTLGTEPGKENALVAFQRYWANAAYGSEGAPGIWSSFVWGGVEVFLLDDRYYRGVGGATMLGRAQLDWLLERLAASTAVFKVLVSGSQWTHDGSSDSWAAYGSEREQILDHVMERDISGVVLVSGDIHHAEVIRLRRRSATTYEVWELTSSPLANVVTGSCVGTQDELVFCNVVDRNFGLIHFDAAATPPRLTYELRAENGAVRHTEMLTLDQLRR